jgi:hypothetical protein
LPASSAPGRDAAKAPGWAACVLAVLAFWCLVQIGSIAAGIVPVLKGELADSDAYLQLVKASRLLETGDWYDSVLPRSNWPYGEVTTWTRSLDVVLVAGASLLRPFMSSDRALFWFGVALSPLCALASAFAVGWMGRPLLGAPARVAAMLLIFLQPGFLSYTYARGPNHHGIIFLAFIVACGFALRALGDPENRRAAIGAGISTGIGLWISMEFLLPMLVMLSSFGLLWLWRGERWTRANRGLAVGCALSLAILLPLERLPGARMLIAEYDRLSVVHVVMSLLILAFWLLAPWAARRAGSGVFSRAFVALAGVGVAGLLMHLFYPKFLGGPLAGVDPALLAFLVAGNVDWQPILPVSLADTGRLLLYLGSPLLCLPWALRAAWCRRTEASGPGWLFLALMLLVYVAAGMRSVRFVAHAEIIGLVPLVDLMDRLQARLLAGAGSRAMIARVGAVSAILVGPTLAGVVVLAFALAGAPAAAGGGGCVLADILPLLNDPTGLGSRRQVILAEFHSGSEILYRTDHAVLATPMFLNPGVLAAYDILTAPDDAGAEQIIDARHVSLILLCPDSAERTLFKSDRNEGTFYNRLVDGPRPEWIEPLSVPAGAPSRFRLFAVRR